MDCAISAIPEKGTRDDFLKMCTNMENYPKAKKTVQVAHHACPLRYSQRSARCPTWYLTLMKLKVQLLCLVFLLNWVLIGDTTCKNFSKSIPLSIKIPGITVYC